MRKMKKLSKGFTMIELLIVIAVLGILAVAVLSAINPIEQINRGKDTGSRSDAEQVLSAIDRYYTTKGYYPWQISPNDGADAQAWTAVDEAWLDSGGSDAVLDKLSEAGTGEIKASFVDRISQTEYNTLYVYNGGDTGDSTYICFDPQSASFEDEAEDRCTAGLPDDLTAASANICDPEGDGETYYSCLP
ncbi:type II secretion system protein [Candidatus Microgenomates bacterium]|jgi:prepilin-type N-terminal cleavage/methylation domain-containing protein|nr:MAG: type II secretion system protein [Candidatus Microgenomates bacterium]